MPSSGRYQLPAQIIRHRPQRRYHSKNVARDSMKKENAFKHGIHTVQEVLKRNEAGESSLGTLARLPPEIRSIIWQYVTFELPVKPPRPGRLKALRAWVFTLGSRPKAIRKPFLLVSRQVCNEARYALNHHSHEIYFR